VKWSEFVPLEDHELEALRTKALLLENMDPLSPVVSIKGIEPPRCDKCGATLPFDKVDYKNPVCREECRES
jgi:hypothetical protein